MEPESAKWFDSPYPEAVSCMYPPAHANLIAMKIWRTQNPVSYVSTVRHKRAGIVNNNMPRSASRWSWKRTEDPRGKRTVSTHRLIFVSPSRFLPKPSIFSYEQLFPLANMKRSSCDDDGHEFDIPCRDISKFGLPSPLTACSWPSNGQVINDIVILRSYL